MVPMKAATAGLVVTAALVLAACGETASEKAEVATCKKVVRLALNNPETLTFPSERVEETSEGDEIFLEVEFKNGETSGQLSDRCWFAGYGDKKRLRSYSHRDSQTAEYKAIPAEEFAAIVAQLEN